MKARAVFFASAFLIGGMWAVPALADIPKFAKTCLGKVGWSTHVCVSSNGTTLTSSYNWKGSVPTRGSHTGCTLSGNTITCSGGVYRTARGSDKMDPVRVKLSNGKATSIRWN